MTQLETGNRWRLIYVYGGERWGGWYDTQADAEAAVQLIDERYLGCAQVMLYPPGTTLTYDKPLSDRGKSFPVATNQNTCAV
jgi:hypothetical protein